MACHRIVLVRAVVLVHKSVRTVFIPGTREDTVITASLRVY